MGFPNMNYLDPDATGAPVQTQTYYRDYEDNRDNDVKVKREEFSNAREQMPNNTFIKLFHFLNADAADGNPGAAPGNNIEGADNTKEANGLRESGANGNGPRGDKQDELQSI